MFGKFLVKQKVITVEQLTEALNYQVIYGGRLGTNLVESGFIKEEELVKELAKYHHVSAVSFDSLLNIASSVIKLIPKDVAKKIKVIPFNVRYKEKGLDVITMDPARLDIFDELSFNIGLNVNPYIINEVKFLYLLEKYYGVKRDIRYITLSRTDREELNSKGSQQQAQEEIAGTKKKETGTGKTIIEQTEEHVEGNAYRELRPLSGKEEFTTEADFEEMFKMETSRFEQPLIELSHEMELETLEIRRPQNLTEALDMLSKADSRNDIAGVVLGYALTIFKRIALFIIYKGTAIGWEGAGKGVERFNIKQLVIPLEQPSAFKFVNDTGSYFLGPVQNTELNNDFFLLLGDKPPKTVVIMPVHFKGRLVQMIYGDNGSNQYASPDIGELLIVLQKVPEAIENMVLRKRRI